MTTVYDIPTEQLIRKAAEELKKRSEIQPPAWAAFSKTGVHKEMPPEDPDWWFIRAAAVLRRVYVDGPVGVQRMRSFYGGAKNRGSRPNAFRRGSGSVLRKVLQQLEAAGLIVHEKAGRRVSPAGRAFLDALSHSVKTEVPAPKAEKKIEVKAEKAAKTEGKAPAKTEGKAAKGEKKAPKADAKEPKAKASKSKQ